MKRYELLAVDLDGTLLDERSGLPARNRLALHRAHRAGIRIVLCTGRSLPETRPILEQIGLDLEAVITVGGALVTQVASGRTLARTVIPADTARRASDWFGRRNYSVLWVHDGYECDCDGFVMGPGLRHSALEAWLLRTRCRIRECDNPFGTAHEPLRLTVIDERQKLEQTAADFGRDLAGEMTHNVLHVPSHDFTVLETFASSVNKWAGVKALCSLMNIDPARTAAIGDDVNDVALVSGAGYGVAVGNAVEAVKSVARRQVAANVDCGVAEFIELLLDEKGTQSA